MAKYAFSERYKKDKGFKTAVEDVVREAVLRFAGVDPEALNRAWEADVRPLTLETYEDFVEAEGKSAKKPRKTKKTDDDPPPPTE